MAELKLPTRCSMLTSSLELKLEVSYFCETIQLVVCSSIPGNVFAGASLPYGLAKAVADTNSESNQGGFTTDGTPITGFSSMHDSGTGY